VICGLLIRDVVLDQEEIMTVDDAVGRAAATPVDVVSEG
jgi:hypothetical protein